MYWAISLYNLYILPKRSEYGNAANYPITTQKHPQPAELGLIRDAGVVNVISLAEKPMPVIDEPEVSSSDKSSIISNDKLYVQPINRQPDDRDDFHGEESKEQKPVPPPDNGRGNWNWGASSYFDDEIDDYSSEIGDNKPIIINKPVNNPNSQQQLLDNVEMVGEPIPANDFNPQQLFLNLENGTHTQTNATKKNIKQVQQIQLTGSDIRSFE